MPSKLEELMLYVAHKSHGDPKFGATKLNKILFWADFLAYGHWGKSITGAKYVHERLGPVPNGVVIALNNLVHHRRAKLEEREYYGYTQKRITPLANPDLSVFSTDEIRIVTNVVQMLSDDSAADVSGVTHALRPWMDTVRGEEIPYNSVFVLLDTPVTLDDKAWAIKRLQELQVTDSV